MSLTIPARVGPRPSARANSPHQQLDQIAPLELQETLWARMAGLDHVVPGPSSISLPDTRALHLERPWALGPSLAFVPDGGTEFAHLHGPGDGSLHLILPPDIAADAIAHGWAELHPVVAMGYPPVIVMIYGPRDLDEVDQVQNFVELSYEFATRRPE